MQHGEKFSVGDGVLYYWGAWNLGGPQAIEQLPKKKHQSDRESGVWVLSRTWGLWFQAYEQKKKKKMYGPKEGRLKGAPSGGAARGFSTKLRSARLFGFLLSTKPYAPYSGREGHRKRRNREKCWGTGPEIDGRGNRKRKEGKKKKRHVSPFTWRLFMGCIGGTTPN